MGKIKIKITEGSGFSWSLSPSASPYPTLSLFLVPQVTVSFVRPTGTDEAIAECGPRTFGGKALRVHCPLDGKGSRGMFHPFRAAWNLRDPLSHSMHKTVYEVQPAPDWASRGWECTVLSPCASTQPEDHYVPYKPIRRVSFWLSLNNWIDLMIKSKHRGGDGDLQNRENKQKAMRVWSNEFLIIN